MARLCMTICANDACCFTKSSGGTFRAVRISLTRIMQLLEKKGLIARKGNPEDRRRVHVEITEAGRDMLVAAQPESLEIAEKLRARVGQDKLDELLDLLNSLAENGLE